jgi:AraC-like DNA-binding protein
MTARAGDAGAPRIRYIERQPPAELAEVVLTLWSFQSDAALPPGERYTVWPDGTPSVSVMHLPGAPPLVLAVGARSRSMQPTVHAGGRLWGIRAWPDCAEALLGVPARSLRDHVGVAPPSIAARFESLARSLPRSDDPGVVFPAMERWLREWIAQHPVATPDPRVRAAIRAIVASRGESPMEVVARAAGTSLRQLQRIFPETTGLTLRDYARVRRLREALAAHLAGARGGTGGWSRVAAEAGFVDHAHLTREFLALTGLAPSAAARQLAATEHRGVAP